MINPTAVSRISNSAAEANNISMLSSAQYYWSATTFNTKEVNTNSSSNNKVSRIIFNNQSVNSNGIIAQLDSNCLWWNNSTNIINHINVIELNTEQRTVNNIININNEPDSIINKHLFTSHNTNINILLIIMLVLRTKLELSTEQQTI